MGLAEKRRLGDILVRAGKINHFQLQEALKNQKILGKKLGEILVDQKIITELDIIEAVEEQTGIQQVNLNNIDFDKHAIKAISQNLCEKYGLVPFEMDVHKIKVAMADPLNIFAIDDISIATALEVEVYIAPKSDIFKFIKIIYTSEEVSKAAEALTKESLQTRLMTTNIEDLEDVKNAPVVKMVDFLFRNSIEMRASDIHIEPFEHEIRIRYRIDGDLRLVNTLGIESLAPLVARIKILAGLNIAEKRVPQDGRIMMRIGEYDVDLRVSILPVVSGEKIVIRILNRSSYQFGRERLGLSGENIEKLDRILSNPHGIILVTGPTGSGKSTTLYTILEDLNTDKVNIVTVEDPVEYTLNGVNQVNVNTKAGLTFASGLRSILRQDPDIVMIGEIRDEETAKIATRAAITGHLVLSTLHTNDAPTTINRLVDMGVESYLVASSITGVIAQRLVKKICPHCKEAYEASVHEKNFLCEDPLKPLTLYKGVGCGHCQQTGYIGRTGIYEIMEITKAHREAIAQNKDATVLREISLQHHMRLLADECKILVMDGITTLEELADVAVFER
ncbi:type II secretion system protein GspE [Turicibacter sanguinis]|uniref:GspE/PulE family protein n=1 Tax=Turicibacter sanguinis TaxID=154288 RepID=UPI001053DF4C|nr:GspE/PulE family protein [Turicibacter sanguinis]MCU7195386.1 GspE/PulE family protein [Turicibacter sanguinis]MCU7212585.1 GspE/PulE family protein [Turicibacter sanguinis]MDB8552496.1 GspE/PulE family protein [Turicibacter sanguinis]MTH07440.1 type II secretion system protein GspE [Turicibacter sanguinis]MTH10183.1 type II secretion system protein GspE [Turicibacter sanguinis]